MALEAPKSPELLSEDLSDLTSEIKKENFKKVGLILDELNATKVEPSKQKEVMKNVFAKTKETSDLYSKKLVNDLSGKYESTEAVAFDNYMKNQRAESDESMKKSFTDMSAIDKANVLFGTFGEGLISRIAEEKVDLSALSDKDFDELYKKIGKKMWDSGVILKESLNKVE